MDKEVFKKISYGMYLVASNSDDILSGCIVNTVVQITSKGPIIAVSINKNNYTNEIIKKSHKLSISILSINTNKDFINKFGFYSSKDINKFKDIDYDYFNNTVYIKENACSYIIGEVINIIDVNTHDIFLVKVNKSEVLNDDKVLTYEYYQNNMKGTSSKNAPTYIEKEINASSSVKYRCTICGHIYDEAETKIKFEDLPDDWVCPICGVGKDKFEKIA